ncbi:MAG: hypothetical protein QOH78_686, partial [Verrucomicrobiota bacterium]
FPVREIGTVTYHSLAWLLGIRRVTAPDFIPSGSLGTGQLFSCLPLIDRWYAIEEPE